eukprot:TRINITY_DN869_c0_g1_i4.p1 TRINITY_DN869_c0_g1~~TRINITY_DN869_c0_g1_i4.p1  ORF type:complete len:137 (-),score=34.71 TRINITY_DN869_c0_g1_i4:177-587(-)
MRERRGFEEHERRREWRGGRTGWNNTERFREREREREPEGFGPSPWMDEVEKAKARRQGGGRQQAQWGREGDAGAGTGWATGNGGGDRWAPADFGEGGDKWKHDMFEEVNRSPSPKAGAFDANLVDPIEALLSSLV